MNRRLAAWMRLVLFAAPLFALISKLSGAVPAFDQGEIAGAKFTIARPAHWNRQLLILVHGFRDENAPLVAQLAPGELAFKTLLDRGWMIATTSFRRNGMIIADAIADIDALRADLGKTYGTPDRVILEGESTGGLIVTLMAEREPELYAGAVAIGAVLSARESNMTLGLSLQPKIPLLFLTNQSELEGPKAYVSTKADRSDPHVRPVLFRVSRAGHANVNQRERLAALNALLLWLDRGRDALPKPPAGTPYFDATIPAEPQPSQVAFDADRRGFTARVTEISDAHGNILLNAQPADFAAIGIGFKAFFKLTHARGQTYRVLFGHDPSSVKKGEWVVFPSADGFFWLARNGSNAAATANLQRGDLLSLRRYDSK